MGHCAGSPYPELGSKRAGGGGWLRVIHEDFSAVFVF